MHIFKSTPKVYNSAPKPRESSLDFDIEDTLSIPLPVTINTDSVLQKSDFIGNSIESNIKQQEALTPRYFIERANTLIAKSVSFCTPNSDVYLELFKQVLSFFVLEGLENNYNFLLNSFGFRIDKQNPFYELPNDYHHPSNLFVSKNCRLYKQHKRFTFQPFESWSETVAYYTYTINRYKLYTKIPFEDCNECSLDEGNHLVFEYFYNPSLPEFIDSPIYWLPNNVAIKEYILGLLLEEIYTYNNVGYLHPRKEAYRKSVISFATGQTNVNSTKRINKGFIVFRK